MVRLYLKKSYLHDWRVSLLLKDARNYWKMFEGEGDKKKKVYPRLPNVWGKKDTPFYIMG